MQWNTKYDLKQTSKALRDTQNSKTFDLHGHYMCVWIGYPHQQR